MAESPEPTQEQHTVIGAEERRLLVCACPGSGKTWTTVRRVERLVKETACHRTVALLSFTNAVVDDLRAEIRKTASWLEADRRLYLGTLDAFLDAHIVRPFGAQVMKCTRPPALHLAERPGDRKRFAAIVPNLRAPVATWTIRPDIDFVHGVTYRYRSSILDEDLALAALRKFASEGWYSHEHRAFYAYLVVKRYPVIREALKQRFAHIVVDEVQDTSQSQQKVLRALAEEDVPMTLVGDADQSIYSFRGGYPQGIEKFRSLARFEPRTLSVSFRCSSPIVELLKAIGGPTTMTSSCEVVNPPVAKGFIIEDDGREDLVSSFAAELETLAIPKEKAIVMFRGRSDADASGGEDALEALEGIAKHLAKAAVLRDRGAPIGQCFDEVRRALVRFGLDPALFEALAMWRGATASKALSIREHTARFILEPETGLPDTQMSTNNWLAALRVRLPNLLIAVGLPDEVPRINRRIPIVSEARGNLKSADSQRTHGVLTQTIHFSKGLTYEAILVLGGSQFFSSALSGDLKADGTSGENRRLLYVALSRARRLVWVGVPRASAEKYADLLARLPIEWDGGPPRGAPARSRGVGRKRAKSAVETPIPNE